MLIYSIGLKHGYCAQGEIVAPRTDIGMCRGIHLWRCWCSVLFFNATL